MGWAFHRRKKLNVEETSISHRTVHLSLLLTLVVTVSSYFSLLSIMKNKYSSVNVLKILICLLMRLIFQHYLKCPVNTFSVCSSLNNSVSIPCRRAT